MWNLSSMGGIIRRILDRISRVVGDIGGSGLDVGLGSVILVLSCRRRSQQPAMRSFNGQLVVGRPRSSSRFRQGDFEMRGTGAEESVTELSDTLMFCKVLGTFHSLSNEIQDAYKTNGVGSYTRCVVRLRFGLLTNRRPWAHDTIRNIFIPIMLMLYKVQTNN